MTNKSEILAQLSEAWVTMLVATRKYQRLLIKARGSKVSWAEIAETLRLYDKQGRLSRESARRKYNTALRELGEENE